MLIILLQLPFSRFLKYVYLKIIYIYRFLMFELKSLISKHFTWFKVLVVYIFFSQMFDNCYIKNSIPA